MNKYVFEIIKELGIFLVAVGFFLVGRQFSHELVIMYILCKILYEVKK